MNKILILLLIISVVFSVYVLIPDNSTNQESNKIINKNIQDNSITSKIPFQEITLAGSKISLLKPKAWHTYQERTTNGLIYYITPYKYEDLGLFKRGLSITIIRDVSKTEGITPDKLALSYIENVKKKINPKVKLTKVNIQYLKGYLFRIEDKKGGKNSLVTSFLFVADDKNDLFYSFVFQYERSKWKNTYPIRNTIFKNIKFIQ